MSVPVRSYSSLCLVFVAAQLLQVSSRYQNNLFFQTCHLAANELNASDCWVCAHMPSHQGAEFKMQALPANLTDFFSDNPVKGIPPVELTVLDVEHQATFPVCFKWAPRANAPALGITTRCQDTIERSTVGPLTFSTSLNYSSYELSDSGLHPLLIAACRVWKKAYTVCFSVERWEAQEDHFWICGNQAYKRLPEVWSGSCALGHVIPAIRVTKERPLGRIRNVRTLSESLDIVNTYKPLTDSELYGSALVLPQIGVVRVGWAIYRLQALIELLSNETSTTFETLGMEQRELRKVALQNRMALDMILASHGGVCALIGEECCVFVPDASEAIFNHAQHIASIGAVPKDASHAWLLGVKEWFGSWWGNIVFYALIFFFSIVGLLILFQLSCCIFRQMCKLPAHTTSLLPHMTPDIAGEDEDSLDTEATAIADLFRIDID